MPSAQKIQLSGGSLDNLSVLFAFTRSRTRMQSALTSENTCMFMNSLSHTLSLSLTHLRTHSPTYTYSLTHSLSLTHLHTHTHSLSLTLSHTHSLPHSSLFIFTTAKQKTLAPARGRQPDPLRICASSECGEVVFVKILY